MARIPLSERMNGASKLASVTSDGFKEMVLDIDLLVPSHENFYPIEKIAELAENMLDVGQIEPIIIGNVNGVNKIASGHRRYFAIKKNVDAGHDEFRRVRCSVKKMSQPMFMLTLTSANAFTRKLDDATLVHQAKEMEEALNELVSTGEIMIDGKKRDYMAAILGVSSTKMAQVNKINSSLVEEGKEALYSGKINFSKAYEASKLDPDKQRMVIQDDSLLSADVKKMVKNINIHSEIHQEPVPSVDVSEEEAEEIVTRISVDECGVIRQEERREESYDISERRKKCARFLSKYEEWGIWFEEPRLGATYYRLDMPDGSMFVVVKYQQNSRQKTLGLFPYARVHFINVNEPFDPVPWKVTDPYISDMFFAHGGWSLL